jgi:hypothetical protein
MSPLPSSLRDRTFCTIKVGALAAVVAVPLLLQACGGGEAPPPSAPPAPSASAAPSAAPAASAAPPASASAAPPAETASAAPPPAPTTPASTKVTTKNDPAWAGCHQSYEAKNKEVVKDVAAMAKSCAAVTKMKEVGKPFKGKQADKDTPQSFPLKAKANHCYRVYAQAAEGIKDLDLAIKDSTGAIAGEDSTDDPSPVVFEDGAVCFKEDDAATVIVSVGMGSGAYAVQVWGD